MNFRQNPLDFVKDAAIFQRLMRTALIGLFAKHCTIHLDGRGFREHNANMKQVLGRL